MVTTLDIVYADKKGQRRRDAIMRGSFPKGDSIICKHLAGGAIIMQFPDDGTAAKPQMTCPEYDPDRYDSVGTKVISIRTAHRNGPGGPKCTGK